MHRLVLLLLSFGLILIGQTQTDTLVSVFHHNYLMERHAELMIFADDLVVYAQEQGCSNKLQRRAIQYRDKVAALEVWKSEAVFTSMGDLDQLLRLGNPLREEIVQCGDRTQLRRQAWYVIKSAVPYLAAILLFPVVYFYVFRRD